MSNGASHEEQYQSWLRSQEIKGRKVPLEGEIIPQKQYSVEVNLEISEDASPEVLRRLGFDNAD
jgi:hypothetical protein